MTSHEKWALVTGVSQGGMGDALVKELMSRNVNVIATGLTEQLLSHLKRTGTTAKLEKIVLDVTSTSSISAAAKQVDSITNGRLDLLINNAGYGYMMPLIDAEISKIKRNFDVNVFGLLEVTQAFFPMLRAARGIVANQASIAGLQNISQPYIGAYSANKTAVIDLSNTLRVELAPFGVKVVTMVTGSVNTPFWETAQGHFTGIPSSSPYQPIKEKVEGMMAGSHNPVHQYSAEKWAKAAVSDLLQDNPPTYVRRGHLATVMPYLSWLLPSWVCDWLFMRTTDLIKLKAILDAQESSKKNQ